MTIELLILILVWCLAIIFLIKTINRSNIREAIVVFFVKQCMTWIFGLLVVEFDLIEYPIRLFKKATASSFSFEYFIYPSVCVFFNLHYPKNKSTAQKIGWYLFFSTWMTILEVLIEKYTDLIHYNGWTWYWTWMTLFITFYMSRQFYLWFYKSE